MIPAGLDIPDRATGAIVTDVARLRANWRALAGRVAPAECAAVVKADAYGLGARNVIPALVAGGCRTFFVATADEAEQARQWAPGAILYVLDGVLDAALLASVDARPVLGDRGDIDVWIEHGRKTANKRPAALQIDTGLNRRGISLHEARALAPALLADLDLSLMMSHLACADDPANPKNEQQRLAFDTARALFLGVPASLALMRHRIALGPAINTLLLLPLVMPGIVLGTSLYVFQIETEIATGLPVMGSLGGLIAAHTLVVIPWVVRLVTASLVGFDRTIEEAAQNLGAGPFTTFRRVTLPSIRPGIVAAGLFGFVTSFGNLEMSLFLVGPGRTTLPIAILQYLEWKIDPTVAAASVIQIVLIGAAMIVTDRYVKLSRVV